MARFLNLLIALEFWLVGGLIAASMIFTRLLPIAVGAAILFWGLRWLAPDFRPHRTPVNPAVIMLLLTIPVTLWATINPERTLLQVERLLTGIALMYIIANWARTPVRLNWLFMGTAVVGFLIALSAPISVDWATTKIPVLPPSLYERFQNLLPDRVHPNVIAGFLILFAVFTASGILFMWRRLGMARWLGLLVSGASIAGILILTQSRGSWIALAIALLVLLSMRWRWGWVVSAASITGLVLLYFQVEETNLMRTTVSKVLVSYADRLGLWDRAIMMIGDFPFTGIGMGNFGEIMEKFYPLAVTAESAVVPHSHNLFLQIAVDLGLPGLIAWLIILGVSMGAAWNIFRTPDSTGFFQAYGAGLFCSQIAMIAHGMTDSVTWGLVRPAPLVWALWGMAMAGYMVVRRMNPAPTQKSA